MRIAGTVALTVLPALVAGCFFDLNRQAADGGAASDGSTTMRELTCMGAATFLWPASGHCYSRVDMSGYTWDQARASCEGGGGYLATFAMDGENEAVIAALAAGRVRFWYWFGLNDSEVEGSWTWITGEAYDSGRAAWTSPQPSNGEPEPPGEDCTRTRTERDWNDVACTTANLDGFLCEDEGWIVEVATQHAFKVFYALTSWSNARTACSMMGSRYHLATLRTRTEQEIARSLIYGTATWIGLSDPDTQGTFVWENGEGNEDPSTSQWLTGEPNGGIVENCVGMVPDGWNDGWCSLELPYLCEREP